METQEETKPEAELNMMDVVRFLTRAPEYVFRRYITIRTTGMGRRVPPVEAYQMAITEYEAMTPTQQEEANEWAKFNG